MAYQYTYHLLAIDLLCPPTKGEGGHIGFSADLKHWCQHGHDSVLYLRYLLNIWMEFHQTCIDTSLDDESWLDFGDLDFIFKATRELR